MQPEPQDFSDWLNTFFASYYSHRPVSATFIGVHDHDHRLPDYSEKGAGDTLADMQNLLNNSHQIDPAPLSTFENLDHRLAQGFLETQIREYQSRHFQRGNPSLYTGEAVFGILALFLTDFASLDDRVECAIHRMEAIPTLFAQARENLEDVPPAWTERAIRECDGALAFFGEGIDLLVSAGRIENRSFARAAEKAAAAFLAFKTYLESELRYRASDHYACGEETFLLYLRRGHFTETDPDEIVRYAEEELAQAARYLNEHAGDFGESDDTGVLSKLSRIHPTLDNYYSRYQELWEAVRETAVSRDLLTWPEFPIRYIPRPAWVRKAAPYLYFLYYRSPAAFQRPGVHDYLVTPIGESMPPEEQRRLLQANNDSVIKLNHVIHHGSIGHHVQNWHAFRSESRIGRMAAVDCASRIAMFCGGTMAEGWACYATDLMSETGFLTPLEQYAERHSRIRMCARAVVDLRLHQGQITWEQAAEYYERKAGMAPEAARNEATKNSMFPGAALMYLLGSDEIHRLRRKVSSLRGSRFSLREFHDQFLSYGSIPVSLISADMIARTP